MAGDLLHGFVDAGCSIDRQPRQLMNLKLGFKPPSKPCITRHPMLKSPLWIRCCSKDGMNSGSAGIVIALKGLGGYQPKGMVQRGKQRFEQLREGRRLLEEQRTFLLHHDLL